MTAHTANRAASAWPTAPGALRMRPLPREAAASYLTRLAATYQLNPAHLLDGLHITATGTPAAPPAAELHLSNEAVRRLSAVTRTPPAHLARALPPPPPAAALGTTHAATARWQPLQPAMQPLPACTACTAHRSPHTTVPAWIHPDPALPRTMICTRHQQAASDPRRRAPLNIRSLPDLTRARLAARRRPTAASLSWATTITTRWYDHHQHLHIRWHERLHQLTAANPHLTRGAASPTLTCRGLITYPETLTLAAALDRLPPHPLNRAQQTAFLHHLAGRLHLPRLAPADHDRPVLRRRPYRAVLRLQPSRRRGVPGRHRQLVAAGHDGRGQRALRVHQGVLGDRLHRGPQADRGPRAGHARHRRPGRPLRGRGPAVGQAHQEQASSRATRDTRTGCSPSTPTC